MQTITLTLTGTRPLIMHSGRLANPFDAHTRRLKALTDQKKKTFDVQAAIQAAELRAGYYETTDGQVGLPTANVFAALKAAAKTLRLGQQLEKALRFRDETVPILIDGKTATPDAHAKIDQNAFVRSVRVNSSRTMRTRPIVHSWQCAHAFELDTRLLNPDELQRVADIAGRDIGLGDWRPRYGTFDTQITNGKAVRK